MNNRKFAQNHVVEADTFNGRVRTNRTSIDNRMLVVQETIKTAIGFVSVALIAFLLLIIVLIAVVGNLPTYLDSTNQLMRLFVQ